MAVVDEEQERRPLLGVHATDPTFKRTPAATGEESRLAHLLRHASSKFRSAWPIVRILVLVFLYSVFTYVPVPSLLDRIRSYTCAAYYETHPELLPSSRDGVPAILEKPCSVPGVESRVGFNNLVFSLLSNGFSSLSLFYYGPALSTWGRKPIGMIGFASRILNLLSFALLPLGYPYGDLPSNLSIRPTTSIWLISLGQVLVGLTGSASLCLCFLRYVAVDAASPSNRSLLLNWVFTASLAGLFVGPVLSGVVLEIFPGKRTTTADWNKHTPSTATPPRQSPIEASRGNPAALWTAVVLGVASMLWLIFFVPETLTKEERERNKATALLRKRESLLSLNQAESKPFRERILVKASECMGPLKISLPLKDGSGRYDWRLTKLSIVLLCYSTALCGLETILIFLGFKFDWGPDKVGFALSAMGFSRALWLAAAVPVLIVFLERVTRKPARISRLLPMEIEALAKSMMIPSSPTSPPGGSAATAEEDRGRGDAPGQVDHLLSHYDQGEIREMRRELGIWRARIDLKLTWISFLLDLIGWLAVSLGSQIGLVAYVLAGNLALSFGSASSASLPAAAIAIVEDMKSTSSFQDLAKGQRGSDAWLAAHSILESFTAFLAPLILNLIYSLTVETRVPCSPFLVCSLLFSIAFLITLTIDPRTKVEQHDQDSSEGDEAEEAVHSSSS